VGEGVPYVFRLHHLEARGERDRPHRDEGALAVALLGALVKGARRDQGAFEAESRRLRQAPAHVLDRA
jgi:hypothetical protein